MVLLQNFLQLYRRWDLSVFELSVFELSVAAATFEPSVAAATNYRNQDNTNEDP
jgi:hypothetical protein